MGKSKEIVFKKNRNMKSKRNKSLIKTMIKFKTEFKKGISKDITSLNSTFSKYKRIKKINSRDFFLDYGKNFTTLTILSLNISIRAKIISIYKNKKILNTNSQENYINKGTILILSNYNMPCTLILENKTQIIYAIVTNNPHLDGCINSVLIEF